MKLSIKFKPPCSMPNGLQCINNEIFIMDQLTDNVFVINQKGNIIRTINTITENGSGITIGGGFLWTASNGRTKAREYRSTDTHISWIYKLDLDSGEMIDRIPTPDGGGIHGIEWDDGKIWITAFNPKALILVDANNFKEIKKIPINQEVAHGLARVEDGIWCADRRAKEIIKYDVDNGNELEKIKFPKDGPDPHGLSIDNKGTLWYCDAVHPPPTTRDFPEIGTIQK